MFPFCAKQVLLCQQTSTIHETRQRAKLLLLRIYCKKLKLPMCCSYMRYTALSVQNILESANLQICWNTCTALWQRFARQCSAFERDLCAAVRCSASHCKVKQESTVTVDCRVGGSNAVDREVTEEAQRATAAGGLYYTILYYSVQLERSYVQFIASEALKVHLSLI